ncbi:MAG: glycogen synthase [Gemmatimonadota bacterium]|nr:glycogen synthase [Gemmatimonadota bacterium]
MRILQLASEAVPFAKTGGLGDVVGALSAYLGEAGHRVELVLPLYRDVRWPDRAPGGPVVEFAASELGTSGPGRLVAGPVADGLRVWFVDVPELYDRDGLYGTGGSDHPDNLLRFAAYVRAALLASDRLAFRPEIVHCHDWQAALAPAWLGAGTASVLTIHNMAYQGWFPAAHRTAAGAVETRGYRVPGEGDLNLLAAGIRAADQVTTVSPRYAEEIATPEFGFGLDPILRELVPPVIGILNGIDTEVWDPSGDPWLPMPYGPDSLENKRASRAALAEEFGIDAPPGVPVFGLVSRLVDQKGIGLFEELRDRIAKWTEARFVFLGTGDARHERTIEELGRMRHVGSRIAFSERLAHLVEAGADFFLMPSRFEPCGLNQMISQRYGTLPIVHRVGGLADSVTHADRATIDAGSATGIVFEHYDAAGLEWAIGQAIGLFADGRAYRRVQKLAMRSDHSWAGRGREYEILYDRVLTRQQQTTV